MKRLLWLLMLLNSSNLLFAQNQAIYSASPVYMNYDISELVNVYNSETRKIVDRHAEIAGSPYVFDDFIPGTVFSRMEKAAFHINLNMNAVTDLFEFKHKEEVYEMPNFAYDSIVIGESVFIPVSIVKNDKVNLFSMEVLASDLNGNYLLKKHVVKFMDRVDEKPFVDAKPARYKPFPPTYHLYLNSNRLVALDNLKRLANDEAVPDDLNAYIRKNKIKRRDESDLKQMFYHIFSDTK